VTKQASGDPRSASDHRPASYYPVFLDLRDRPCVVVGGGGIAAAKCRELAHAGARVRAIASEPSPELRAVVSEEPERVELVARAYRDGDLAGAFLAFAERGDDGLLARVFAEAEARQVFCNAQDRLPFCSMIAPAVLRRGDLAVAISTAGRAPALAVRLRDELATRLGPEYAQLLELAGSLRPLVTAQVPDFEERRRRWYALIDSDVLALLRQGRRSEAEALAANRLGVEVETVAT
jgi:siroheme synthase-like protein